MNQPSDIAERYAPESPEANAERAIASPLRRLRSEPLLPDAGAGGAPLTAVIAIISFLAAIALAAFLVIAAAANDWTSELKTSFTIQVKGADPEAILAQTAEIERILASVDGVLATNVIAPEDAARLLEPWLGKGNVGDYLNVPAIVEVRASEALRSRLDNLGARLAAVAPGAVIDDHGEWRGRLAAAARAGQLLAFGVFIIVMGAACATAVFAARAGLAANGEIVSLLHLVGATDEFIANEVQRRFIVLGLRGSALGLLAALAALFATGLVAETGGGDRFYLPGLAMTGWFALMLLIVPISVCLVAAASARITVLRALRNAY